MIPSLSTYAATALIAAAVAFGGAWQVQDWRWTAKIAARDRATAAAATQAALAAIKTQERLQEAVQKVGERHETLKRKNASTAAAAGSELDGLRHQLATRDRAATEAASATGRADGTGAERQLLGHCAAVLVGVAKEADRIEAKLIGLQDYVRGICQAPP